MKRPLEPDGSDEPSEEASSPAPKPFDIFAGLPQEPLLPAEGELKSEQLSRLPLESQSGSSKPSLITEAEEVSPAQKQGNIWIWVLLVLIALVLGVVIGAAVK